MCLTVKHNTRRYTARFKGEFSSATLLGDFSRSVEYYNINERRKGGGEEAINLHSLNFRSRGRLFMNTKAENIKKEKPRSLFVLSFSTSRSSLINGRVCIEFISHLIISRCARAPSIRYRVESPCRLRFAMNKRFASNEDERLYRARGKHSKSYEAFLVTFSFPASLSRYDRGSVISDKPRISSIITVETLWRGKWPFTELVSYI